MTPEPRHVGRVALVTGATRNIGRGIALALGRAGAHVLVGASAASEALDETMGQLAAQGSTATPFVVDLADTAALEASVDEVASTHSRVDILVNNAVARGGAPLDDVTTAMWDRMQRVNLLAPLVLTRAVSRGMRTTGWGRIVNVSGIDGFRPWPGGTVFNTLKMGLVGLTRATAVELVSDGIMVNAIVPGPVATDRAGQPATVAAQMQERIQRIPMGRLAQVEEVVATAMFLCSDEASYVTGQELFVTGGP